MWLLQRKIPSSLCIILCFILVTGIQQSSVGLPNQVVHLNDNHSFVESTVDSWLPGWKYRKSHNITGAAGAGSNYQIPFKVHYSAGTDLGMDVYCGENCSQDFSDIRFTGSDEQTTFDYWIETMVSSDYAVFWVNVAENLEQSVTVFMYYGNEYATTQSNGIATCEFFEDFSSPLNSTKWNHTGPSPTFSEGIGEFEIEAGMTWDHLAIATPDELPNRGYRLRTNMRFNTANNFVGRYSYFGFGHSAIETFGINGVVCIDIEDIHDDLQLHSVGDDDFDFHGTVGQVHVEFREYELLVQPFGVVSLTDGITTVSGTLDYEVSLRPSIGIHVNGAYNGNHIRTSYDSFWITKWQPVEPQHDSWGNFTTSPYKSDDTNPVVDFSIEDFPLEAGDWGWAVWWNVTEANPYMYEIILDDVLVEQSIWEDYTVVFSLQPITTSLGPHNITLKLIDLNHNIATDEVIVTVSDTTAPTLSHPEDIEIVEGDRITRLIWQVYEIFPQNYLVERDSIDIMSGSLFGRVVSVDLDTLSLGSHTLTITVWDTSGNNGSDSVTVHVIEPTTTTAPQVSPPPIGFSFPDFDSTTLILYGIGFVFLVATCLLFRKGDSDDMSSGYQYY